ncbi:polysaccharide deacetylase family protein [Alkalihalophilus pseudofirmus]|uniref:Polysaccharide deacetylase family protein n=1 Tax=Alkalihalophilus pseudofirmus TaxID=79885 RepID=A0AAJ2NKM7_ALKPS|nr:polysaccharide deacetylase family protein [Alkalihalophilus pseudofirmus]MDV2884722.1 polysaccharide deacetylase family protein [Alkalihalophilus pseudofirmus]
MRKRSIIKRIKLPGWTIILIVLLIVTGSILNFFSYLEENRLEETANASVIKDTEDYSGRFPGLDVLVRTKHTDEYTYSIALPETKNESINSILMDWVAEQEKGFTTAVKDQSPQFRSNLTIELDTKRITDEIYSFIFSMYYYLGGANGKEEIQTFTVDLSSGSLLEVDDIINLSTYSKEVKKIIINKLQQEEVLQDVLIEDQLNTLLKSPDEWMWSLNQDSFSLYFDEYEIAPGFVGAIELDIPLDDITPYIYEDIFYQSEASTEKVNEQIDIDKQEWSRLDPEGKYVALTFDDGPHPSVTPQVLDTLNSYDAKATFFMLGIQAQYYPSLVQAVAAEGHEIGNHSMNHPDLTSINDEKVRGELEQTNIHIKEAVGFSPATMRPPYGAYNELLVDVMKDAGTPIILWSIDSLDWKSRDKDKIAQRVLEDIHDGAIVLMHDIHQATAAALPIILESLHEQGYEFVTVSELLYQRADEIGPHYQY